jgi:alcohol dehydrogenase YqhD (iron-dependent ADH family)
MEGLIINAMESCDRVLADLHDYQGRADLMWTATLALNGLTAAGLGKVGFPMHMIEHSLSALYNVPHGAGLSAIIPGWMRYQCRNTPQRFAQFAERVFDVRNGSSEDRGEEGIAILEEWFQKVKSPTSLAALNIPEQEIPRIAENAVALARIWRMPDYDEERIQAILAGC